jgi:hypothetical protein
MKTTLDSVTLFNTLSENKKLLAFFVEDVVKLVNLMDGTEDNAKLLDSSTITNGYWENHQHQNTTITNTKCSL